MAYQEYLEEDTLDLIEYMRMDAPGDREGSDDAFTAFILSFREYLQKQCRKVALAFGMDEYMGDEIAEKTFLKFRFSSTFSKEKCKTSKINTCIKLYLAKVAKNILIDIHREQSSPNPFTGDEQIVYDLPDASYYENLEGDPERIAQLKKKDEVLREILYNRLTEKQRIVYLTYKQYERDTCTVSADGTEKKFYLPRKLLKKLKDDLQITQPTIRKYKQEANAIIEPLLKLYGK